MKRSNRLVLLVGVFLAIVAFVGILVLSRQEAPRAGRRTDDRPCGRRHGRHPARPRGSSQDQVTTETVAVEPSSRAPSRTPPRSSARSPASRSRTARRSQPTPSTAAATARSSTSTARPACAASRVQVDQVTGVGTVIKTGDYVDMVVGLTADKFPVVTVNPGDDSITVVAGLNSTSVKLLLQGMQVLGTLLPPPTGRPPRDPAGRRAPRRPPGTTPSTASRRSSSSRSPPQQAEVIKFAQLDGHDHPGPPRRRTTSSTRTTGAVLPRSRRDDRRHPQDPRRPYGVLPPELVETVLPPPARRP